MLRLAARAAAAGARARPSRADSPRASRRARRASPRTRPARSRGEHLPDERAVPLHRDHAVGLLFDVRAAAAPHLLEVEDTLRGVADRARERDRAGPAGRRRRTRPRGRAGPSRSRPRPRRSPDGRRRGSRRAGSGRRSPASPFARPTTCTSALESESGSRSRFWYGRNRTVSVDLEALRERDHLPCRAPKPAITIRTSSRSRRNVAARTRLSRSCACPTLPECMTTKRPTRSCFRAHALSRGCGVIARVSTQFGITRSRSGGAPFASRRSRIVSPIATIRSARRRYAPTSAPQHADDGGVVEPVELGRDLREDVLADDEQRRADAPPDEDAEVADDRRVGHAEDEVRRRAAQRVPERRSEVRDVVHGPPARAPSARRTSRRHA